MTSHSESNRSCLTGTYSDIQTTYAKPESSDLQSCFWGMKWVYVFFEIQVFESECAASFGKYKDFSQKEKSCPMSTHTALRFGYQWTDIRGCRDSDNRGGLLDISEASTVRTSSKRARVSVFVLSVCQKSQSLLVCSEPLRNARYGEEQKECQKPF